MSNATFVKDWFNFQEGKRDRVRISEGNLKADNEAIYSYGSHFPLAIKCENGYVLNGDRYSVTTSSHQHEVRSYVPKGKPYVEIPMSVLDTVSGVSRGMWSRGNGDSVAKKIRIVYRREAQYRTVKYKDVNGEEQEREEHLLGGCVVEYEGRYFLSGTDEGAPWGRGYFLTELSGKPKNFDHAFSLLTPEVVKRAKKSKKQVFRQGEWFFIEYGDTKKLKKQYKISGKLVTKRKEFLPVQATPAGMPNREPHHTVTECVWCDGVGFSFAVRGIVRHTQGDHKKLKLGDGVKWYQAVHNLQVMSWTSSGRRVD